MKQSIILILCLMPFFVVGQINYQEPPWDLNCDSLKSKTRVRVNNCTYQKMLVCDSVLNNLYIKNLNYYDKLIEVRKKKNDVSFYQHFKSLRDLFIESQKKFIEYRESLCNLANIHQWDGGEINDTEVHKTFLAITIERIKRIEKEYLYISSLNYLKQ